MLAVGREISGDCYFSTRVPSAHMGGGAQSAKDKHLRWRTLQASSDRALKFQEVISVMFYLVNQVTKSSPDSRGREFYSSSCSELHVQ